MKHQSFVPLFLFTAMSFSVMAQDKPYNPYEKFGKDAEVLTLSNGKYQEFFDRDSIEIIGSAVLNTNTMKVIGFVETDTLYSEATLEPEVVSRWLSRDPLAAKYPELSPYNFVGNSPIMNIDPDGREIVPVNYKSFRGFYLAIGETFTSDQQVAKTLQQAYTNINLTGIKNGTYKNLNDVLTDKKRSFMKRKSFEKLINKSNLSDAKKETALELYGAITSDTKNYIDITTSENSQGVVVEGEEGYYKVTGEHPTIEGEPAKTPGELKETKIANENLNELSKDGNTEILDKGNNNSLNIFNVQSSNVDKESGEKMVKQVVKSNKTVNDE